MSVLFYEKGFVFLFAGLVFCTAIVGASFLTSMRNNLIEEAEQKCAVHSGVVVLSARSDFVCVEPAKGKP